MVSKRRRLEYKKELRYRRYMGDDFVYNDNWYEWADWDLITATIYPKNEVLDAIDRLDWSQRFWFRLFDPVEYL
ncbi:MAG: hypothetical protein WC455_26890 [Dehalococcoidia bacterium]|jgi:hypothetical protein